MSRWAPVQRVLRGDEYHRTRLHDERGNFAGMREVARIPQHALQALGIKLLGRYPRQPWWNRRAIARIESLLRPDWRVVEFGSGMSTVWLAERVGFLHSIEHDDQWFARVSEMLGERRNVRYELRSRRSTAYSDLSDYEDGSLDFAVVDGSQRPACVIAVLPKLASPGYIYLDNSDMEWDWRWNGVMRGAVEFLLRAVRERGGTYEYLRGLASGNVSTTEGLLARFE
jgi:hypothetical protein